MKRPMILGLLWGLALGVLITPVGLMQRTAFPLTAEQKAFQADCDLITEQSEGDIFCQVDFRARTLHFVTSPDSWNVGLLAITGALFCELVDPPGRVLFGLTDKPLQEHHCAHPNVPR